MTFEPHGSVYLKDCSFASFVDLCDNMECNYKYRTEGEEYAFPSQEALDDWLK